MTISSNQRLLISFFIFAIALLLQFRATDLVGLNVNFALATVLTLAFFVRFIDVIFLSLFGVVALTWRPGFTPEMATFLGLPLAAYAVRLFFPGKLWLNHILLTACGIVLFHLASGFSLFTSHLGSITVDTIGSTLVGALLFQLLDRLYAKT